MIPNCIRADIQKLAPAADPRLVYGYMLLEDFRFGNATRAKMNREIKIAAACVAADPAAAAERLAQSYGL